ncbi:hypothetical protein K435DRAFT_864593 [Dendrothele bispora CBS 962.96]|uniref:Uncharacterized protein n=1 Tax=Dendrothele bispora (strain CBS 962.96) TaxID=1314807 RepID=A0A4S8LLN3_DENBC|nr:hypothetical protein K435DRAFT_864593 [Dendrothele bispora CBS 962.96]
MPIESIIPVENPTTKQYIPLALTHIPTTTQTPSRSNISNSFPWSSLLDFLDLVDIMKIRQICRETKKATDAFISVTFTAEKLLSYYFRTNEIEPLQYMRASIHMYITGPNVLSLLQRQCFHPNAPLQLYVTVSAASCLLSFFRSTDWTCVTASWTHCSGKYHQVLHPFILGNAHNDILRTHYPGSNVEAIFYFVRDHRTIYVNVCTGSPIKAILNQVSTAHTTLLSPHALYCLFPRLLLREKINLCFKNSFTSMLWAEIALRLYTHHFNDTVTSLTRNQLFTAELRPVTRYIGDLSSCVMVMTNRLENTRSVIVEPDALVRCHSFNIYYTFHNGEEVVALRYNSSCTYSGDLYTTSCHDNDVPNSTALGWSPSSIVKHLTFDERNLRPTQDQISNLLSGAIASYYWHPTVTERPSNPMIAVMFRYLWVIQSKWWRNEILKIDLRFQQSQGVLYAHLTITVPRPGRDGIAPPYLGDNLDEKLTQMNVDVIYNYDPALRPLH